MKQAKKLFLKYAIITTYINISKRNYVIKCTLKSFIIMAHRIIITVIKIMYNITFNNIFVNILLFHRKIDI